MFTLFIIFMIMGLGVMICEKMEEVKDKIEYEITTRKLAKYYNSEEYKMKKKEEELKEEEEKRRKEEQKRIEAEKRYEELCIIRNEIIDELIKDEYITVKEVIAKCEEKHNRKIDRMRVEDEIDHQNYMASYYKGYDRIRMDKRGKQRPKNLHEEIMELRKDVQRMTKELNESIENYKKKEEEKKAKRIGSYRDYENMSDYDYYRSYFKSTFGVEMTGTYPGEASKELQDEIRSFANLINNCIEAEEKSKKIKDVLVSLDDIDI